MYNIFLSQSISNSIIKVIVRARREVQARMEIDSHASRLQEAQEIIRLLMFALQRHFYNCSPFSRREETLLSERGQEDVLRDAFQDGSSVVCHMCGGLVARARWESHSELWCPSLMVEGDEP